VLRKNGAGSFRIRTETAGQVFKVTLDCLGMRCELHLAESVRCGAPANAQASEVVLLLS